MASATIKKGRDCSRGGSAQERGDRFFRGLFRVST
jgi:hypothetical protein